MWRSNGEIIRWRSADRALLGRTKFADGEIEALVVSHDGRTLIALLPGGDLKAIDPESGDTLRSATVTAKPDEAKPMAMPVRPLGKTGAKVSLFGLGCHPLGAMANEDDAREAVQEAGA